MSYSIKGITGLVVSSRRSIVFLLSDDQDMINARDIFAAMNSSRDARSRQQRTVLDRFDHWISGGIKDNWFHGWSERKYIDCFAFKWKYRNVDQRFYGFLCNPLPRSNPQFRLCVLHSHAQKVQWNTETKFLDLAVKLSALVDVKTAIQAVFPDHDPKR
jgi:hypothetical protein